MPDALSDAFVLCSSDLCQSAYRVSSAEPSGADTEGVIGGGPLAWIAGVKHLCRVSVWRISRSSCSIVNSTQNEI